MLLVFEHQKDRRDNSTADLSKTQQLTSEVLRWINSIGGKGENICFGFCERLSL